MNAITWKAHIRGLCIKAKKELDAGADFDKLIVHYSHESLKVIPGASMKAVHQGLGNEVRPPRNQDGFSYEVELYCYARERLANALHGVQPA